MAERCLPHEPAEPDDAALVSIRTGSNTTSRCVGTLHLRIDTTLLEVRQKLVAMAQSVKKSRRSRSTVTHISGENPPESPVQQSPSQPVPPLTPEQREKLTKIKLHALDFSSPFQFVRRGGVASIPKSAEHSLKISDVFPILPNIGSEFPHAGFLLPEEIEYIGLPVPERKGKRKLTERISREKGNFIVAVASLFVRQQGPDHSEKVIIERLLMQNNVFGRLQTPQQLGTLISKHNANMADFLGRSVLQECAQEGNYYIVAFLLGLSFVEVDAVDWRGQTALHLAVDRGHLEVVSLLLDAGTDILAQDCCKRTPLHIALERRADVLAARLCAKLHANGVSHETLSQYRDLNERSPVELFSTLSPCFSELCRFGQLPAVCLFYILRKQIL